MYWKKTDQILNVGEEINEIFQTVSYKIIQYHSIRLIQNIRHILVIHIKEIIDILLPTLWQIQLIFDKNLQPVRKVCCKTSLPP